MKNLSRNYVYWPKLDDDLERLCRSCEPCRMVRDAAPRADLHPWEYPLFPWQRLHADFAEYLGKKYLILVDAHSKWIEALPMGRTDAQATITALMTVFSRFGLPSQLVTDNGPPFLSHEFKEYCMNNCISHVTSAPYRPQGNGAAENAVKTIKKALKRAVHSGENVLQALNTFLFHYRNCDHATTGVSPAVLLTGRRMRMRLDALRPDVKQVVRAAQQRQVAHAGGKPQPTIRVGEPVLARDYTSTPNKWSTGTVSKSSGPVSYRIDMGNGVEWRRHRDQILPMGNKSRLSLSRASIVTHGGENEGSDHEVDDTFEDASEASNELATEPNEAVAPNQSSPPPPPLGVSARALRAHVRAVNKDKI
uniref:RNA-directed DNA polymerase n=1 Tax=Heliothis virescens TaxID=7102 RepID=A0A2A4JM87_HELVI